MLVRARGVATGMVAAASFTLAAADSLAQRRGFSPPDLAGPARVACKHEAERPATRDSSAVCRVDLSTYLGWRVYESRCASCHAAYAQGSSFAPPLAERMAGMSLDAFLAVLERGYAGEASALPAWGDDPEVRQYSEALWVYLAARADGTLPAVPLARAAQDAAPASDGAHEPGNE